ncbi:hypothetical protein EVAR_3598_1 [Eumeta japonica]|uniref:Uncharacterized protein n=1 Tax=Eumeta variegata TaxID=151549 RepID=A0A4C1SYB1_EUMVA|nr:hypothetical protein EVAR_3598_1 [Eumeta japonica]
MELSELINENDFDDEPPTLTPFLQFSHWYLIQKPDQMLSRSLIEEFKPRGRNASLRRDRRLNFLSEAPQRALDSSHKIGHLARD